MPAPPDPPPLPSIGSDPDPAPTHSDEDDDRVFLVLHKWWKEAQEGAAIEAPGVPYAAAPAGPTSYGMKVLSMFISDQPFTLRRADDLLQHPPDASPGRSYALLAADLFKKARQWHIDSAKSADGLVNIYPVMLRASVASRDTNALTVKIGKKDNSAENFKRANKILSPDSDPVHIWDFSGRTTYILMNEWNRMPQDLKSSDQDVSSFSVLPPYSSLL